MKTSTEIGSTANYVGYERAIEMVSKAGFNAYDASLISLVDYNYDTRIATINENNPFNKSGYVKFARKLKRVAEDNGIICNQSHAPFPVRDSLIRNNLKKSIEITAELGGEYCIIHPNNLLSAERNAETYIELLPFAKEHNVKIATENMWGWDKTLDCAVPNACATKEDFNAHLDAVNDDFFVACLDIGHAEMLKDGTNAVELIKSLNNRLKCLHIHDNDKWRDLHTVPFSSKIDFPPIIKALKGIDYKGYFTLECDYYMLERGKCGENEIKKGLTELNSAVNKLVDIFEKA